MSRAAARSWQTRRPAGWGSISRLTSSRREARTPVPEPPGPPRARGASSRSDGRRELARVGAHQVRAPALGREHHDVGEGLELRAELAGQGRFEIHDVELSHRDVWAAFRELAKLRVHDPTRSAPVRVDVEDRVL